MNQTQQNLALRCAIYARVSSDKQDIENSLERQLTACREWAQRHGHRILEEQIYIDEAKSGVSTLARPALQKLLGVLRQPGPLPFDAVLVDDDSRLDRGGQMVSLVDAFQIRGVRLISVDSGRDMTNENERLLVHVKSGLNEHYTYELSRRTRNGLASKVQRGFHAGGKVYGYQLVPIWQSDVPSERRDRSNRVGTEIKIDEAQAGIIRRLFTWYAEGLGYREIAHRLNSEAVPSPRGESWDKTAIRAMLLNPKYIGDWSWNTSRWRKKPESLMTESERERTRQTGRLPRQRTPNDRSAWVGSQREDLRIVSDALWEAVQARFRKRAHSPHKGRDSRRTRSPIAGVLTCECGGHIGLTSTSGRGTPSGSLYCAWNRNRGPSVCGNSVSMRLQSVAGTLFAFVKEILLDPARIMKALEMFNRKIAEQERAARPEARAQALRKEAAELQQQIDRLIENLADGQAAEFIKPAIAIRMRRLQEARQELDTLCGSAPTRDVPRWTEQNLTDRVRELTSEIFRADPERVRRALQLLFAEIVVKPLEGDWQRGWRLEMKARSGALFFPFEDIRRRLVAGAGFEPATFGL